MNGEGFIININNLEINEDEKEE